MITPGSNAIRIVVAGAVVATVVVSVVWGIAAGLVPVFGAVAVFAYRISLWLAVCAASWGAVFLAVLVIPGPYDSPAGRAAIPVLAAFVAFFLAGWALGCRPDGRTGAGRGRHATPVEGPAQRDIDWPDERRLRTYLLVVLVIATLGALLKFRGGVPLFADNPDVARDLVRQRSNIWIGLLSEAWTLGLSIALLRTLAGPARNRVWYVAFTAAFTFGAALGASKNSVLVGIVPALVAVLSVRRTRLSVRRPAVVVFIGLVAVTAAVFLGGQRTLAGTGPFEDEFRARYGGNAIAASVASLDLSLSSSVETFGRLWQVRESHPPAWGRYSLTFTGSVGDLVLGPVDLYGVTAGLSFPYYMNTATFVAIPLLDFGTFGAALVLMALGFGVGRVDRRLRRAGDPALQLARAFVIYFAVFGVYELYLLIQPIWLSLIPGLWFLHAIGRRGGR